MTNCVISLSVQEKREETEAQETSATTNKEKKMSAIDCKIHSFWKMREEEEQDSCVFWFRSK